MLYHITMCVMIWNAVIVAWALCRRRVRPAEPAGGWPLNWVVLRH